MWNFLLHCSRKQYGTDGAGFGNRNIGVQSHIYHILVHIGDMTQAVTNYISLMWLLSHKYTAISLTSNSTMAFFMLSTSKIVLISSWTGLGSFDLVPALAVSLFTASSSCQETPPPHNRENLNPVRYRKHTVGCLFSSVVCVCVYLSVVNLQGVELIGIFGEVGGAPVVARLLFVDTQEVVHGRVLVMKLVQLVASDGGTHSAP